MEYGNHTIPSRRGRTYLIGLFFERQVCSISAIFVTGTSLSTNLVGKKVVLRWAYGRKLRFSQEKESTYHQPLQAIAL